MNASVAGDVVQFQKQRLGFATALARSTIRRDHFAPQPSVPLSHRSGVRCLCF
jgi:hypothetical protein